MKKTVFLLLLSMVTASCVSPILNLESSFRKVARDVIPSVVQVTVVDITTQKLPKGGQGPWDFFFPNPEEDSPSEKEFRMQGLGSGVIISRSGSSYFVLTNNHVIGEGDEITVTLHDKRMYPAVVVGTDPRRDVALVSFETEDRDIVVARAGNSEEIQVGDWVVAIGNPYGLDSTVTSGIVSGLHRSGPTDVADFIQTDASINQGNSGGALVNLKGEVVGINSWIQTPTGGSIGLGFAIPINSAMKAAEDFKTYGEPRYGWLGVTLTDPSAAMSASGNAQTRTGAFITNVYRNSPGYAYGLRPGDLITGVNNKAVKNVDHLIYLLGEVSVDKEVEIEYYRINERAVVAVRLELRKSDTEIREMYLDVWPGFSVFPLSDDIREKLSLASDESGVLIIRVEERTQADKAGIATGDVIRQINGEPVMSVADFYRSINDEGDSYVFSLIREGEQMELKIIRDNKEGEL
ncbi:MAG: trypsin-like peptidase domain-containing protein [Spirochaetales bacterium]|nr:trypsin-like peptidase domain-containing protein [Spirochaetales bacterium]